MTPLSPSSRDATGAPTPLRGRRSEGPVLTDEQLDAAIARTRTDRGLPATIEDHAALARIAALMYPENVDRPVRQAS